MQNTNGSYKCTCDPGYVIENVHECTDIDECLNSAVCNDDNSVCVNTPGTFRCECKEGFSLDQKTQKCKPNSPQCDLECSHTCGPDGNCLCPKGQIISKWFLVSSILSIRSFVFWKNSKTQQIILKLTDL